MKANPLKKIIFSLFRKGFQGAKRLFGGGKRVEQTQKNRAKMRCLITFISPWPHKVTLRKTEEI
jgi:hypothetical protein